MELICFSPEGSITTKVWVFTAIVIDGSYSTIYINGVNVATCSGIKNKWVPTEAAIEIGRNSYGGSIFSGSIDDIRIFARALPSTDIDTLFNE